MESGPLHIKANLKWKPVKNPFDTPYYLLKIVNTAVTVCSNLIGCFEVVPLASASIVI